MESVINYVRSRHPETRLDAMCTGPETIKAKYGIDAISIQWGPREEKPSSLLVAQARKLLGLFVDAVRIGSWVRRHDAVIIPGTGVLEASLPLLPRAYPYSMLSLCIAGRLFGVKVFLVGVGAGTVNQRTTRLVYDWIVRLSTYRSYRDAGSREALRERGLDVTRDHVHPDLAFALPIPQCELGNPRNVGVGVMDYRGTNDDRRNSDDIHASYIAEMKRFVRWLLDDGCTVRLFVGDANGGDDQVAAEILEDVRTYCPHLDPTRVIADPITCFDDLMRSMLDVGVVVAIRYHNVLGALMLSKPTIAIGYSPKHDFLMADMGLPGFCQDVNSLDADRLAGQLKDLQGRAAELRDVLLKSNEVTSCLLEREFAELSAELFPGQVRYPVDDSTCVHPSNAPERHGRR
jgi:polysaccharide pyruvyl transferase WcaK-like protein